MQANLLVPQRRLFLRQMALGAAFFTTPGLFAEELVKTPSQTEGPFYPKPLPLDTDNDLLIVNDSITPAIGDITYLTGKLLDAKGNPLKNTVIEIWQVDGKGVYLHQGSDNSDKRDKNFQGFGRFLTGSTGEFLFRTVKPIPYPGRTPHIHVKVKRNGKELLTTQLYIKGHPGNAKDGIYNSVKDAKQKEAITVDFVPVKESKLGEHTAKCDIVLGVTPEM
jgi:protocatechuate 3,4-dioxygenase beta subunit